jgi:hypothetical protein
VGEEIEDGLGDGVVYIGRPKAHSFNTSPDPVASLTALPIDG